MEVKIFDYTAPFILELDKKAEIFLETAGKHVRDNVRERTRVESSQTKNSWKYVVSGNRCTIGSPLENAVWEEFGTGENADKGKKARRNGWFIPADKLDRRTRNLLEHKYKFKQIREKKDKNGKPGKILFFFTKGKKGTHAFTEAWKDSKPVIEKRAKTIFGELGKK